MKLIYSLLLILCFNNLFSQTGEVIYIATPTKDDSKSQRLKERNEEVRLMSFSLKFNNEQSFFKKNKNVPIKKDRSAIASILLGSNVDLFQFSKQKKVIYISNINNKTYRVADTTKMNNWELYSISKTIENYKCY